MNRALIDENVQLEELNRAFPVDAAKETALREHQEAVSGQESFEAAENRLNREIRRLRQSAEEAYAQLTEQKTAYLRAYPNRSFPASDKDCTPYAELLSQLSCKDLETFQKKAQEQARASAEHFRDDFIFKIRSAIREAIQQKDELNRVIRRLNFGKDRYEFVISKNKGMDGKYYDMFMDDALQIQPSGLPDQMENQLNLFTMEHESQYADVMNELISIFIPPENATPEELEEAKRNMAKYSDYRTYLSFDMQQIVAKRGNGSVMKLSLEQNAAQKLRRRGAEPPVCGTSGKLCPGVQDPFSHSGTADAHPAAGGAGRSLFQDGCGEGGQLYRADPGAGLPGHHQRHQRQDAELSGKCGQDLCVCQPE